MMVLGDQMLPEMGLGIVSCLPHYMGLNLSIVCCVYGSLACKITVIITTAPSNMVHSSRISSVQCSCILDNDQMYNSVA